MHGKEKERIMPKLQGTTGVMASLLRHFQAGSFPTSAFFTFCF